MSLPPPPWQPRQLCANVRDGIQGIAAGVTAASVEPIIKDMVGNTLGQLGMIADIIGRLEQDVGQLGQHLQQHRADTEVEIRAVSHQVGITQGGLDTLLKQGQGRPAGGYRKYNIMESKAVANLKAISSDKGGFRLWHEKFVNILEQRLVGPGP